MNKVERVYCDSKEELFFWQLREHANGQKAATWRRDQPNIPSSSSFLTFSLITPFPHHGHAPAKYERTTLSYFLELISFISTLNVLNPLILVI